MNTLIFATNNTNKVLEIRQRLNNAFDIKSLEEAGIFIDIPEPHDTLEANATEKSRTIYQLTGEDCFSEDTGLEVESLNGEPGVKSARYAGSDRHFDANIDKLLANLKGKQNRKARFRTVISLIINGVEHQFEGICTGIILEERQGGAGFGYDPVFVPDGSNVSFGSMTLAEKQAYSHRAKALDALLAFLRETPQKQGR